MQVTQTNSTEGYWLPINSLVKSDKLNGMASLRGLWSCYALIETEENQNYRAERKYLELLETQDDRVLVKGTIQAGDEIITDGTHRIIPGQLVKKK